MIERVFSIGGAMFIILLACFYLIFAFIYELFEALIDDDRNI